MTDAPTSTLRSLIAKYLLGGGVVLVGLSLALSSDAGETSTLTEVVAWTLGVAALLMGLSVWLFGTLKFFGLVTIDLRRGGTTFVVGFFFCSVRLTDTWQAGAFRLSREQGVFLVVPTLARIVGILVLCYLVQQLLAKWTSGWWALVGAAGLAVALWSWQRRMTGSEKPQTPD